MKCKQDLNSGHRVHFQQNDNNYTTVTSITCTEGTIKTISRNPPSPSLSLSLSLSVNLPSFLRWLLRSFLSFLLFLPSFVRSFSFPMVRWFVRSLFSFLILPPFVRSFIHFFPVVRSFIHSFPFLFFSPFVCSFIHSLPYPSSLRSFVPSSLPRIFTKTPSFFITLSSIYSSFHFYRLTLFYSPTPIS